MDVPFFNKNSRVNEFCRGYETDWTCQFLREISVGVELECSKYGNEKKFQTCNMWNIWSNGHAGTCENYCNREWNVKCDWLPACGTFFLPPNRSTSSTISRKFQLLLAWNIKEEFAFSVFNFIAVVRQPIFKCLQRCFFCTAILRGLLYKTIEKTCTLLVHF